MGCAFSDDRFHEGRIADGFGSDLAVTNQAFGACFHSIVAFDLDHRGQHRGGALLGDLDEFFGQ